MRKNSDSWCNSCKRNSLSLLMTVLLEQDISIWIMSVITMTWHFLYIKQLSYPKVPKLMHEYLHAITQIFISITVLPFKEPTISQNQYLSPKILWNSCICNATYVLVVDLSIARTAQKGMNWDFNSSKVMFWMAGPH